MSDTSLLKRILILDDDGDFRRLVKVYLAKLLPGVEVDEYDPVARGAPNDDFDWSVYDALILDYYLCIHNVTGLDILQAHRKNKYFPATIMMTGAGNEEIAVRALRAGVYDYLRKEKFDKEQLKQALLTAVEKHQVVRARALEQTNHNHAFNKALFYQELEQGDDSGGGKDRVLLLVELDDHDVLEQRFGVIIRDNIVRYVARQCYEYFKDTSANPHITRLNDQSVALLITDPDPLEPLSMTMAGMCTHLQKNPYRFEEKKLRYTVSIGVVPVEFGAWQKVGHSADALLQMARDCANVAARQDGNSFHIFVPPPPAPPEEEVIPEPIPEPVPEPVHAAAVETIPEETPEPRPVEIPEPTPEEIPEPPPQEMPAPLPVEIPEAPPAEIPEPAPEPIPELPPEEIPEPPPREIPAPPPVEVPEPAPEQSLKPVPVEPPIEESSAAAHEETVEPVPVITPAPVSRPVAKATPVPARKPESKPVRTSIIADAAAPTFPSSPLPDAGTGPVPAVKPAVPHPATRAPVSKMPPAAPAAKTQAQAPAAKPPTPVPVARPTATTPPAKKPPAPTNREHPVSPAATVVPAHVAKPHSAPPALARTAPAATQSHATRPVTKPASAPAPMPPRVPQPAPAPAPRAATMSAPAAKTGPAAAPTVAPAAKPASPDELDLDPAKLAPEALKLKIAFNDDRVTQLFRPLISLTNEGQVSEREIFRVNLQLVDKDGKLTDEADIYKVAAVPDFRKFIDRWLLRETIGRVVSHKPDKYLFLLRLSEASLADPGLFNWLRKLLAGLDKRQPGKSIALELAAADFVELQKPATALMAYLHKSHGFRFVLGQVGSTADVQAAASQGSQFDMVIMHGSLLKELQSGTAPPDQRALPDKLRTQGQRIVVDDIQDATSLTDAIALGADLAMGRFVGEPIHQLEETGSVESLEIV